MLPFSRTYRGFWKWVFGWGNAASIPRRDAGYLGIALISSVLKHVRVVRKPVAKLLDLLQRVWKGEIRKPNGVV